MATQWQVIKIVHFRRLLALCWDAGNNFLHISSSLQLLTSTCFQLQQSDLYQGLSICVVCELQVCYQLNSLSSVFSPIPFLIFPVCSSLSSLFSPSILPFLERCSHFAGWEAYVPSLCFEMLLDSSEWRGDGIISLICHKPRIMCHQITVLIV